MLDRQYNTRTNTILLDGVLRTKRLGPAIWETMRPFIQQQCIARHVTNYLLLRLRQHPHHLDRIRHVLQPVMEARCDPDIERTHY